jgi:hypothetical protein
MGVSPSLLLRARNGDPTGVMRALAMDRRGGQDGERRREFTFPETRIRCRGIRRQHVTIKALSLESKRR